MTESNDRLDRIERILENVAGLTERNAQTITELQQLTASNARAIEANSNAISELRQRQELQAADSANITQMVIHLGEYFQEQIEQANRDRSEFQSYMRGMQTENRRILERLEQHFSDGHGGQ